MQGTHDWRSLPFSAEAAAHELAAAETLLNELAERQEPALRWYGAATSALVLGSGQKLHEIDHDACRAAGIALHRRAGGGAAVLFEPGLLMQDIAIPVGHPLRIDDVTESYRWLGEVWVAALRRLGLETRLVGVAEARTDTQDLDPLTRRVCFGGRSPYEVMVGERKLVGFSQVRRRGGSLFQVGIYTSWLPGSIVGLLKLEAEERALLAQRLAARVVGLNDLLPTPPAVPAIAAAFAAALGTTHGVTLREEAWSADERAAIRQAAARYAPL